MFNFFERKNDSIKSMPLSGAQGWNDFFTAGPRDDGTISPELAYAGVPFVYRAVNLRAYALSSLPFSLARNGRELDKEGDEYLALANQIKHWLFAVEANLCIFGAAYLLIEKNQYGQNPTPRPVLPSTITPMYDMPSGELSYFERATNGVSMRVELDDILHFWLHSFRHENAPGASPLSACLGSAATLHNLGRFAQQFFANGALMPTVFFFGDGASGMPSTTTPQEIETFLERMKRVVSGIKNAWKFEALRGNVSAQQIGTPPKDVAAPDLTSIARQDVAVAFGVPESLLLSTSSTYASASADMYHVYDLTVIPEAEAVVLPTLQRWLDTIGLTLTWQPEMLESYQSYQQHQAVSIAQLVGQPVLTQEEGRAILGYGPMESEKEEVTAGQDIPLTESILTSGALSVNELRERLGLEPVDTSEDEKQRELSRQLDLLKKAIDAGLSQEVAAALVGIELPEIEEEDTPLPLDEQPLISPPEENFPPFENTQGETEEKEPLEEEEELIAIRALTDLVAEQTEAIKQLAQQEEVADLERLLEEAKALTSEPAEVKLRQPRDRLGRFASYGSGGGGAGGSANAQSTGDGSNRDAQGRFMSAGESASNSPSPGLLQWTGEQILNNGEGLIQASGEGMQQGLDRERDSAVRNSIFNRVFRSDFDRAKQFVKNSVNLATDVTKNTISMGDAMLQMAAENNFDFTQISHVAHVQLASYKYSMVELERYLNAYEFTVTAGKSIKTKEEEGDEEIIYQALLKNMELFKEEVDKFKQQIRDDVLHPAKRIIELWEKQIEDEKNMESSSGQSKSVETGEEPPEILLYP